jgi:hypothetical protein
MSRRRSFKSHTKRRLEALLLGDHRQSIDLGYGE